MIRGRACLPRSQRLGQPGERVQRGARRSLSTQDHSRSGHAPRGGETGTLRARAARDGRLELLLLLVYIAVGPVIGMPMSHLRCVIAFLRKHRTDRARVAEADLGGVVEPHGVARSGRAHARISVGGMFACSCAKRSPRALARWASFAACDECQRPERVDVGVARCSWRVSQCGAIQAHPHGRVTGGQARRLQTVWKRLQSSLGIRTPTGPGLTCETQDE